MKLTIRVRPGASRSSVGGGYGDPPALVVVVRAQPVDDKANDAVVGALAAALSVKPRHVRVASGHTSRTKHIVIDSPGVDDSELAARIAALMAPAGHSPLG